MFMVGDNVTLIDVLAAQNLNWFNRHTAPTLFKTIGKQIYDIDVLLFGQSGQVIGLFIHGSHVEYDIRFTNSAKVEEVPEELLEVKGWLSGSSKLQAIVQSSLLDRPKSKEESCDCGMFKHKFSTHVRGCPAEGL